jgi:hypothetical protein
MEMECMKSIGCKIISECIVSRLHLPGNYIHDELIEICKQEGYAHYNQITELENTKFNNDVIPRKVCVGVYIICENLKSTRFWHVYCAIYCKISLAIFH